MSHKKRAENYATQSPIQMNSTATQKILAESKY